MLKETSAIVVNVDKSSEPGCHWLAFYCESNNIEFFYLYGNPPKFYGRFVVKVWAVNNDTFCGRWLFKSPHSFESLDLEKQKSFSWISKFLHQIKWEDGELPYNVF
ncbi:hypothetical protein AVEN_243011-1 [Araneus ventricosus]|uniref:Uncharacterized protein n=1 Tax=Araneus ventricosus TaxID=182803 RepID=A0A4Y2D5A3_ARAVE|nr:hypothetical protein AVEN_243011-1 [Araneus ventricosus]